MACPALKGGNFPSLELSFPKKVKDNKSLRKRQSGKLSKTPPTYYKDEKNTILSNSANQLKELCLKIQKFLFKHLHQNTANTNFLEALPVVLLKPFDSLNDFFSVHLAIQERSLLMHVDLITFVQISISVWLQSISTSPLNFKLL